MADESVSRGYGPASWSRRAGTPSARMAWNAGFSRHARRSAPRTSRPHSAPRQPPVTQVVPFPSPATSGSIVACSLIARISVSNAVSALPFRRRKPAARRSCGSDTAAPVSETTRARPGQPARRLLSWVEAQRPHPSRSQQGGFVVAREKSARFLPPTSGGGDQDQRARESEFWSGSWDIQKYIQPDLDLRWAQTFPRDPTGFLDRPAPHHITVGGDSSTRPRPDDFRSVGIIRCGTSATSGAPVRDEGTDHANHRPNPDGTAPAGALDYGRRPHEHGTPWSPADRRRPRPTGAAQAARTGPDLAGS